MLLTTCRVEIKGMKTELLNIKEYLNSNLKYRVTGIKGIFWLNLKAQVFKSIVREKTVA